MALLNGKKIYLIENYAITSDLKVYDQITDHTQYFFSGAANAGIFVNKFSKEKCRSGFVFRHYATCMSDMFPSRSPRLFCIQMSLLLSSAKRCCAKKGVFIMGEKCIPNSTAHFSADFFLSSSTYFSIPLVPQFSPNYVLMWMVD